MKDATYVPPKYGATSFNCPRCNAYSTISWGDAKCIWDTGSWDIVGDFRFAYCLHCFQYMIWTTDNAQMIYPVDLAVPLPNSDLPDEVRQDYIEAATILSNSPRGAGALLRLAIQKLVDSLVEGRDDLNTKIGILVDSGLDSRIQKALDIVRVIGNNSVHPGQIEVKDSPEVVNQLFSLVNLIGQKMITEPKEIDELYAKLPEPMLKGIEKRDKKLG